MRTGPALILGIVLLASPAHGWSTWQADAGRSGHVAVPAGPFDVVGSFALHPDDLSTAALPGGSYAMVDDGAVAVANRAGSCILLRWDLGLATVNETPLAGCRHGSLQGYAASQDLLAICTVGAGDDAIFQLRDARSHQMRFRVTPNDILHVEEAESSSATWSCQGAALGQETAFVPMVATFQGEEAFRFRLVAVNLEDGTSSVAYATDPTDLGEAGLVMRPDGGMDAAEFWPRIASLADDGLVVTGLYRSHAVAEADAAAQPALLWLSGAAAVLGEVPTASILVGQGEPWQGSVSATAMGHLAAMRLGSEVVVVDPHGGVVRRVPLPVGESAGSATIGTGLAPPIAFENLLIVPTRTGLVGMSSDGLELEWKWSGLGRDWLVGNAIVSFAGELFVILYEHREGADGHEAASLARLDARTGQLLQVLPLPLSEPQAPPSGFACDGGAFCPGPQGLLRVMQAPDGMVVSTSDGHAVRVAPARGGADIQHSDVYPARAEQVSVTVPLTQDAPVAEVVVVWGDGAVERQAPAAATTGLFRQVEETTRLEFVHTYAEEGDMRVAATTVFHDGTTATESFVFHVGKTPPGELNFMQRQFAAENQDRTYGILGLAVAMAGGLYAFVFRKRRHHRIRRHLQMLDAIHERSFTDPEGAVKELDAHHRHIRSLLMSGRIDDGEFRVLADRAAGLSKRIHRRLLGPLSQKLSTAYRGQLESAFEDGLLTAGEAQHLLEAIGHETGLDKEERGRLRALIEDWTTATAS